MIAIPFEPVSWPVTVAFSSTTKFPASILRPLEAVSWPVTVATSAAAFPKVTLPKKFAEPVTTSASSVPLISIPEDAVI